MRYSAIKLYIFLIDLHLVKRSIEHKVSFSRSIYVYWLVVYHRIPVNIQHFHRVATKINSNTMQSIMILSVLHHSTHYLSPTSINCQFYYRRHSLYAVHTARCYHLRLRYIYIISRVFFCLAACNLV